MDSSSLYTEQGKSLLISNAKKIRRLQKNIGSMNSHSRLTNESYKNNVETFTGIGAPKSEKKNLQQRKIVDELSAKFNKTLSEYAASEKVLHQLATSYVNTHETWNDLNPPNTIPNTWDELNPPNTIPNTWDEMNQVCKDKGKRLCNSKELCISNQPITSLNTFGGTDNWVAVNDKQNEWLTYATFDNRLCKTATQVAGGVPAWGTTKTPDGWFRAAKCCTNTIPNTWDELNPPNTIPNTWDEMNQVCKDKGKRLCNSKELCISNQPITSLNTFGGTDNWVAVNDKQNEWLTYATFDNRLCKTATQVAGGVPAWGTTKTPDGWFRAAKCCTNINASESLAQQQSIVKTKARHLDNVAKEVYTALNAMITEEHNIDEQLLKEMRKLRKDTAIYDKTIQKSTDMNITNPTTSAMETTSSLEMSSNSVKYLLWSGLAGLGVLAALKAAY